MPGAGLGHDLGWEYAAVACYCAAGSTQRLRIIVGMANGTLLSLARAMLPSATITHNKLSLLAREWSWAIAVAIGTTAVGVPLAYSVL